MFEKAKSALPKKILKSKDIDLLRDIRGLADDMVQNLKKEQAEQEIDKYKPIYEGKFLLKYGRNWDGPIAVDNRSDIIIAKINKINFVGNGFFRCDANVIEIIYGTVREKVNKVGLTADSFEEVSISSYHDDQYDIDIEKKPTFLTIEQVDEYIETARNQQESTISWFEQNMVDSSKNKIITLKNYNDLGRCSYGTLRDKFDSEKDKIYFKGKLVKINKIDDLFPFLWQQPGVSGHCDGESTANFNSEGTHWHQDFDEAIIESINRQTELKKKISKAIDKKKKDKYKAELADEIKQEKSLNDMLKRLDREMEKQKKLLRKENR